MDYQSLAKELIDLRRDSTRMFAERRISQVLDGRFYVLHDLFDADGTAYPKELRRDMGVSTARIASILNQLEEHGYITREDDPEDNRQTIVKLTDLGAALAEDTKAEVVDWFAALLEQLGPEDAAEYVQLQEKITQAMEKQVDEMPDESMQAAGQAVA